MAKKKPTLYNRLATKRAVRIFWLVITAPFALLLVMLGLTAAGAFGRLPSFEELENPKSNVASEIIAEDGKMLRTFYIENRTFVGYEELTPDIVAALVSTEDVRFYGHSGIDYIREGGPAYDRSRTGTGRRLDHHPATRKEPVQTPRMDRNRQTQGVDHRHKTRIQLHQGGDHRDVPQHGVLRLGRLRHQERGTHVLR